MDVRELKFSHRLPPSKARSRIQRLIRTNKSGIVAHPFAQSSSGGLLRSRTAVFLPGKIQRSKVKICIFHFSGAKFFQNFRRFASEFLKILNWKKNFFCIFNWGEICSKLFSEFSHNNLKIQQISFSKRLRYILLNFLKFYLKVFRNFSTVILSIRNIANWLGRNNSGAQKYFFFGTAKRRMNCALWVRIFDHKNAAKIFSKSSVL